jgi:uncharacterized protein YlxW (UPF0749 family)
MASREIVFNESINLPQQIGFDEAINQIQLVAQQKDNLLQAEQKRRMELEKEVEQLKKEVEQLKREFERLETEVIIYKKSAEANSIMFIWNQILNQYKKSWKYVPVLMAIPMVIYVLNRK